MYHIVSQASNPKQVQASDIYPVPVYQAFSDASGNAVTLKRAVISADANGDNTLVALVANKSIRVVSIALLAKTGTALNLYFKTGSTGIFGDSDATIPLDSTGATGTPGFVLPYNPAGWMQTAVGEALVLVLDAGEDVGGSVQYVEV